MCVREVSMMLKGCSLFKEVSKKFQGCFNSVSGQFQRHLKKVSRVFKYVSRKFHKKFQGCFKKVPIKFFFLIFLLYGSHRSYPSRRRA